MVSFIVQLSFWKAFWLFLSVPWQFTERGRGSETHKQIRWSSMVGSLLHGHFLRCHATFTPKKRLLTSEQHSFPLFEQITVFVPFLRTLLRQIRHFKLVQSEIMFYLPITWWDNRHNDNGDSWRGFPSHVFQIQNCKPKFLPGTCNAEHCHRDGRYLC